MRQVCLQIDSGGRNNRGELRKQTARRILALGPFGELSRRVEEKIWRQVGFGDLL